MQSRGFRPDLYDARPKGAAVDAQDLIGWLLVAGLVTFLVGAGRWRLEYEQPLEVSLPLKASDRPRLRWIQYWMMVGVGLTSVGLASVAMFSRSIWATAAAVLYGIGATAWMIALIFRLTVEEQAAADTVKTGTVPSFYPALAAWASGLHGLHMITAYVSSVPLAIGVITDDLGPTWLAWTGGLWGVVFATGFVVTRGAGFLSPPFLAHLFTGALGITLLLR